MENSLKNKIKNDYENGALKPSSNLWDQLEAKLDAKEQKIIDPEKTSNINYWKYAAVVLLMITVGFLVEYSFLGNSTSNEVPTLTKIETPLPSKILVVDTLNNYKKIQLEPIIGEEIVPNKGVEIVSENVEKFTKKKDETTKITKEDFNITEKAIVLNTIDKSKSQKEEKLVAENNTLIVPNKSNPVQYVKADELLFGRELQKEKKQFANSKNKLEEITNSFVQKIKPSSVTIFGVTVYTEDEAPN
ncbi:hypothetical protein [Frigoriflavimonas asaccharolytica]|uniref:Uncharacterized protein n=1 Tax=Frigoriflavimonas asaccharolytica TaxID=2735899 RepID=A0A8J8K4N0_9FLAO|nr:hypothetical protein [Frigoriflavimonas asaccharolytica]NRS91920.1 hypothetical protein [Frigoriflavimonas asaccharolytica]